MGIFLDMRISKSVTQVEWESVYEETLEMIEKIPFAERRLVNIHGIEKCCLVPTEEREFPPLYNNGKDETGWSTIGDYLSLRTAEEFYLPKYLVNENEINPDAGDPIICSSPSVQKQTKFKEILKKSYNLWGEKTQYEPYHWYLLAVACLIADRLGNKAFIEGDISFEQCELAIKIANEALEESISLPDQCDPERLSRRIEKLPLSLEDKEDLFNRTFLKESSGYGQQNDYDITFAARLTTFEKGNTISPYVIEDLAKVVKVAKYVLHIPECCTEFSELISKGPFEQFRWLITRKLPFVIRDKDWEKIYNEIISKETAFARYYSLAKLSVSWEDHVYAVLALFVNDELYDYSSKAIA